MLYLAQIQKKGILGQTALRLLAGKNSDETWAVLGENEFVFCEESRFDTSVTAFLNEGVLVLAEITPEREVLSFQEATHWLLELMQRYLTITITPEFLIQEAERAEQWRQRLTLQSQELSRRSIEIESRREQIQVLEETLQREKQLLEMMTLKLKQAPYQD